MNFSEIKQILSDAAKAIGITEYDVYYSEASDMSAETLKDEISGFSSSDSIGIGFRCIVNGRFGQASCEHITKEELETLVKRAAENALYIESDDESIIFKGSESYVTVPESIFVEPSANELKNIALELQSRTYAESELVIDGTQSGAGTGKAEC